MEDGFSDVPSHPCLVVLTPSRDPLPLSVRKRCASLLTHRTSKGDGWDLTSVVNLYKVITPVLLEDSLSFLTLIFDEASIDIGGAQCQGT